MPQITRWVRLKSKGYETKNYACSIVYFYNQTKSHWRFSEVNLLKIEKKVILRSMFVLSVCKSKEEKLWLPWMLKNYWVIFRWILVFVSPEPNFSSCFGLSSGNTEWKALWEINEKYKWQRTVILKKYNFRKRYRFSGMDHTYFPADILIILLILW